MDDLFRFFLFFPLGLLLLMGTGCDVLFAPGSLEKPDISREVRSPTMDSFVFGLAPEGGAVDIRVANITAVRLEIYADEVRYEIRLEDATSDSPVQIGVNLDTDGDRMGDLWAFLSDLNAETAVLTDSKLNEVRTLTAYPYEEGIVEISLPLDLLPDNPTQMYATAVSFHSGIEERSTGFGTLGSPVELVPTSSGGDELLIESLLASDNSYEALTTSTCPLTPADDEGFRYGTIPKEYSSFTIEIRCVQVEENLFRAAGRILPDTSEASYWFGQSRYEGAIAYVTYQDLDGDKVPDQFVWGVQDRGERDDDRDRWTDAMRYVYARGSNWHTAQHWHQEVRNPSDEYIVSTDSTSHAGLHRALSDLEFWSDPAVTE